VPMTPEQALRVVAELETELNLRVKPIEKRDAMYRGEQPLAYASTEFAKYHAGRYAGFSDNWCGVVGDAPIERLTVTGVKPRAVDEGVEARADDDLWRVWTENEADYYSDLAFLDAGVCSRSFVLVWGNPEDEATPRVTWEHPSQAVVGYDPDSGERRAGLKLWQDGETQFATLYLPDEVWKFKRRRVASAAGKLWTPGVVHGWPGGWEARQPDGDEAWPLPNPMGTVPLVELQNRPRTLGEPISDITGVMSMQNAINLLWAYLFTTADFASFPQRVVLGADMPKVPVLDANGQVVGHKEVDLEKFAVDRVVWLTSKDAEIDQWDAASLDVFTGVMEVQVAHIAAQTRTPQHYLIGKIANLSGDALKAAETGLVKKAEEKTSHYGRSVREVFRLIALAKGDEGLAARVRGGRVLWADVESRSRAQTADELLKMRQIGFPFEFLAARYGLTPTQVAEVVAMRSRELRDGSMADVEAIFGAEGAELPAGEGDAA
jgi:hypothetical protein